MDLKQIGSQIAQRRKQFKLRQEDLAEMSDVTVRSIYKLEEGKENPTFLTMYKICEVLGLEININIKILN